jgi:CheY-like chemotaxis protein
MIANSPSYLLSHAHSMSADVPDSRRPEVRVLIVDDSAPFRAAARELLEHRGYLIVGEAASVSQAIEAIDSQPPDAVLLDVRLQDESGCVVASYLRARYPAVAVLLVTADGAESARHLDGDTSGAFGPVDKGQLAKVDLSQYWPTPPGTRADAPGNG